ncbi:MAG TPA: hypothetical protein VHH36_09490, partial [Candidatus Thermoplasmatota archaeon]|nr:hypothetical protein [Candidatus Thermoplasmatota archaeon]
MEVLLPAFALLAILGALSVAAWPAARASSREGRRALALGTLLAAPLAWLGAFGLVEQLLGLAEPVAPAGY